MVPVPSPELPLFSVDQSPISVLLVDDEPGVLKLTATFLERELPDAEMTTVSDPAEALDALRASSFDCVVSDYEMPGMDGLELLSVIQDAEIEIPFILFTGRGSEEIASQAISAGVDEYLQKGGTEMYEVLANKIETLVEKHRAESQVQRAFLAIESAQEGIGIIDEDGIYRYMNEAYAAVYNRDRAELVGRHWDVLYPEEETRRFYEEILPELERTGTWRGVSTGITKEGTLVPERLVLTQMADGGHVCIVQDLSVEDELRAELELKSGVLDALPFAVVVLDPTEAGLPVRYANPAFETLTGYAPSEISGRGWAVLEGDATDDATRTELREAVDVGTTFSAPLSIVTADGTAVDVVLDLSPVRDDEGTVTMVVTVLRERGDEGSSE